MTTRQPISALGCTWQVQLPQIAAGAPSAGVLAESAADDLVALPVAVAVASPPANAELPTGKAVLGNTADSSDADNRNSHSLFANKFVREALDFGYRQTIMN